MSDSENVDVLDAPVKPAAAKTGIAHRLYTGEISYDFVAKRNRWYIVSGVILLVSILAIAFRGLSLGIEFRGGADFQAPDGARVDVVFPQERRDGCESERAHI